MKVLPALREALLAVAAAVLLSLAFVFPWIPNATTVPTTYAGESEFFAKLDASIWTYMLAWGARHPDRFYEAPILSPLQTPLVANDPRLTEGIWSIPLFRAFDPVRAWGITTIVALAATFLGTYVAGRALTGSRWGGAALGVFFAFGSFRACHVCHVEGLFAPFLALAPAAGVLFVEKPARRRLIAAAGLAALAVIEYSYTAVALSLCLLPALAGGAFLRRVPPARALGAFLLTAALVAVALAPVARTYAQFHRETALERDPGEIDAGSADLVTWATRADGALWLPGGEEGSFSPDKRLFPGFALLLVATAGLPSLRRRAPEILVMGLLSLLLSFGTLRVLFWSIGLPQPAWSTPYEVLAEWLLPLRAIRSPARLAVLSHLALAFAGAFAIARLGRGGSRGAAAAALLLALAFLESRAGMRETRILPERAGDPAYAWIAGRAEAGGVVDAPMGRMLDMREDLWEAESLFAALVHGRPTPNGTIATLVPWHESIATHLARPRAGETPELLRALGVQFVVARDEGTAAGFEKAGLAVAHRSDSGSVVFEVDTPCPVPRHAAEVQERLYASAHERIHDDADSPAALITAPKQLDLRARKRFEFDVVVENTGAGAWCGDGAVYGQGPIGDVLLQARAWRGADGNVVRNHRGRPLPVWAPLPCDVHPGETVVVRVKGIAPRTPGLYDLDLDLIVNGLRWFHATDSGTARVEVVIR